MGINEIMEMWNGTWWGIGVKRSPYETKKNRLRYIAQEWQYDFENESHSWGELMEETGWFSKMAKRYGLTEEFRENGII